MADVEQTTQGDTVVDSETTASTQTPVEEVTTPVVEEPVAKPVEDEAPAAETPTEEKVEGSILKRETEDTVPDTYDWKLSEDANLSDGDMEQLNKMAKDSGLLADEAPKAYEFARSVHEAVMEDAQSAQAEELEKMKSEARTEWEALPDHETKTLHMQKFLKKHNMVDHFIDSHYETDIKLMSAMAAAGALISEATNITGTETAPKSEVMYPNSPELY